MKSEHTFADELPVLSEVPGVLYSEDSMAGRRGWPEFEPLNRPPFAEFLDGFEKETAVIVPGTLKKPVDRGTPLPGYPAAFLPVDISAAASLRDGAIEELLAAELGVDVVEMLADARSRSEGAAHIAKAVDEFGTEAFATYLPWHIYALSDRTPWGMYFFLERLVEWAADLQRRARGHGLKLNDSQALRLAFFASYRHELFHFHVEAFCIRQEILSVRPVYRPYDRDVFRKTAHSHDWLEEALAQAVVLESTLVSNRLRLPKRAYRAFMEAEFDRFGAGYRAFRCQSLGGVQAGHQLLAAQIMSASTAPTREVTDLYTPKCEYRISANRTPGYIVWIPWYASRFQLAMPKRTKAYAYLRANGFMQVKGGPGDHERWQQGKQTVQVNFRGNEIDMASAKAIARALNKGLRQVRDEMAGRRSASGRNRMASAR